MDKLGDGLLEIDRPARLHLAHFLLNSNKKALCFKIGDRVTRTF
jgi:hypothetical protein